MVLSDRRSILAAVAAGSFGSIPHSPAFASMSHSPTFDLPRQKPSDLAHSLLLNDGSALPLASFGVQIYDDDVAAIRTTEALSAGFRSFFASIESGNQVGFARAIAASGLDRANLYIAGSVLSDASVGYRAAYRETRRQVEQNLANMARGSADGETPIGSLDLMLLEYPARGRDSVRGQWHALEDARAAGLVKHIGVANFSPQQLDQILTDGRTMVPPSLNQLPYTLAYRMPYAQIREEHRSRGIALQAWSPLGGPSQLISKSLLRECATLGAACGGRSAYQVALRWIIQNDVAFTVHSTRKDHLRDDLAALEFKLDSTAMERLDAIAESTVELRT
jgi:2,5-diketo-D-gluconate reductase A